MSQESSSLWVARASRALVSASRGNDLLRGAQAASLSISAASRNAMRAARPPARSGHPHRKPLTMHSFLPQFSFLSLRERTEVRVKI